MLEDFGVPPEAEAVYRTVLDRPGRSIDALVAMAGAEGDRTAEALAILTDLDLVRVDGAGAVVAVPPERAIELLLAREEALLDERRLRVESVRAAIPQLVDAYVEPRRTFVSDEVELLSDSALVRSRLFQLTSEAGRSAWALHPGPGLDEAAVEAALPLDAELTARGIDSRMIVEAASLGPQPWNDYLAELERLGHQVRVAASLHQRAIVIDGRHAVVPSSDAASPGAYLLHGPSLVGPLVALFEEIWSHAERLDASVRGAELADDTLRHRQVAALLARGLKDDAVARRLGVSVRTVRRLIASTMDELGAASRFEAGVLATRRGWVASLGEPSAAAARE